MVKNTPFGLVATLFVSLLLTLILGTPVAPPSGYLAEAAGKDCGFKWFAARPIRLFVESDGRVWLNYDEIPRSQLNSSLKRIYGTRAVRVLYLDAADDATHQTVMQAIDEADTAVPRLELVVITAKLRKSCEHLWAPIVN
jgi:biopolymer transport protein ExbD